MMVLFDCDDILCIHLLQMTFSIHFDSPVLNLSWYGGRGCLGCVLEDGTTILNESILFAKMCGDVSVVQVSTCVWVWAVDSYNYVLYTSQLFNHHPLCMHC